MDRQIESHYYLATKVVIFVVGPKAGVLVVMLVVLMVVLIEIEVVARP